MSNFYVRKSNNNYYINLKNNIASLFSSIDFPDNFYKWNNNYTIDIKFDAPTRAELKVIPTGWLKSNSGVVELYDESKFEAPTIITTSQAFWKQNYAPMSMTVKYKNGNDIKQYTTIAVDGRVKGYGSFQPYNRKSGLRIKSSQDIPGIGSTRDLTFNNMIQDGSRIAEHIVYKIFRDYGLPAIRTNYVRIFLNDTTLKINNISNNLISTTSNHYLFNGMRVKFVNLSNISNDQIFYVINEGRTNTSFKVSSSLNGSVYNLPSLTTSNPSEYIEFYIDYGEYLNVENIKNIYRINELFGANNTKHIFEVQVNVNKEYELMVNAPCCWYDIEYTAPGVPDISDLNNFLTKLNSRSNWYENISSCMDVDQFVKFSVIENLLGQGDGYTTFLTNAHLHSDINGVFRIMPWGTDSYFKETPQWNSWKVHSRWLQQCWAHRVTLDKFKNYLIHFTNWLNNESNIISYINNIFDEKIQSFDSDLKKPSGITTNTMTASKNNIISWIQNTQNLTEMFLARPYPVTNLSGQKINNTLVMTWDPVTSNLNGDQLDPSLIEYGVRVGADFDHKYFAQVGATITDTSFILNNVSGLYDNWDPTIKGSGLYATIFSIYNGVEGFAAQPVEAYIPLASPPPVQPTYVPTMKIRVTEVMSNQTNSPDWFEITNFDTSGISITGWKMDDNSQKISDAVSMIPSGWTVLNSGESAVFIESNSPSTAIPTFRSFWNLSNNKKIGTYTGAGVGLSSGGDAVHLYPPSGSSSTDWVYLTGVSFGAATTNRSFYWNYDSSGNILNTTGVLSSGGYAGAYMGSGGTPLVRATGSPCSYLGSLAPDDPSISPNLKLWLDASQPVYSIYNAVVSPLDCATEGYSDVSKWPSRVLLESFDNTVGPPIDDTPYLTVDTNNNRRFIDFGNAYSNCGLGGKLIQQSGFENDLLGLGDLNAKGYTIFIVAKLTNSTPSNFRPIWNSINGNSIKIYYDSISSNIVHSTEYFFGAGSGIVQASYSPENSWKVFTMYLNRKSSSQATVGIKINNNSDITTTVNTFNSNYLIPDAYISQQVSLGAVTDARLKGALGDIITYDTYLDPGISSSVIQGLMTKWGIN